MFVDQPQAIQLACAQSCYACRHVVPRGPGRLSSGAGHAR